MSAAEADLVTCEGCGEDVLAMFELRGDAAVGADALCSKCLADETTDTSEASGVSGE